jgi:transposase-like protein
METFFPQIFPKFFCEYCDLKTNNKKDFNKHLLTAKHEKLTKVNIFPQSSTKISQDYITQFICKNCNKQYTSRVGLWKHRKICLEQQDQCIELGLTDKDIINALMKHTEKLANIIENGTNNTTNSHNTNTNIGNKNFNLNFYLNETCKDAININDFVSSIKMNLEDLEHTGRVGYVEGITNIFVKNLNNLENHMRPLHCSDFKREVLYIKDNDEWTKETDQKPILTKAIKTIANQNIKQINLWKEKYPDCTVSDSKKNNLYFVNL